MRRWRCRCWRREKAPRDGFRRGFRWRGVGVVGVVPLVEYLGDGGSGGGFVHDGLVRGEGGDEGLQGQVVDGAGVAAGGVVDQGDRVVGEQGVGSAG